MEKNDHNGWSNYETWAVMLWIDNDRALSDFWRTAARQAIKQASTCGEVLHGKFTLDEMSRFILTIRLKGDIEADAPDVGPTLYADLLSSALAEVNWVEVADELIREARETTCISGHCPECGTSSKILDVGGAAWGYCLDHSKKWFLGPNASDSQPSAHELWRENARVLREFEEVSGDEASPAKEAPSHG